MYMYVCYPVIHYFPCFSSLKLMRITGISMCFLFRLFAVFVLCVDRFVLFGGGYFPITGINSGYDSGYSLHFGCLTLYGIL